MSTLKVKRIYPRNHFLKGMIKYFWVLKSDTPKTLEHKLLPVNNIDLVLNLSAPMKYISGDNIEETPKFSFCGIRNKYYMVHQTGTINMFGISFFPAGLYPFLKTPLSEFFNKTIDLNFAIPGFNTDLGERLFPDGTVSQQIDILEDYFSKRIEPECMPDAKIYHLLNRLHANIDNLSLESFCEKNGISQRKLERIFHKYIGTSPKRFKRVNRFQVVLNKILYNGFTNFTSIAYENDYYDQAHFIKDFKSFAGCSPSRFLKEKMSVKEIMELQ